MAIATLTSKGRITIPKDIRNKLRLHSGDKVEFQVEKNGTARILPVSLSPSDVFGMLAPRTRVKAKLKQMDEAVEMAFREGDL
jgi:antitoxin PrlF